MTRNGKIARLPKWIREQLNQRLQNGEPATSLVDWLNGLEQVRRVVVWHFNGVPVREQNISEWKNGGYLEWERDEERQLQIERLQERAAGLKEIVAGAEISSCFATLLATEMTELARTLLDKETDPEKRWERLCAVHRQISLMRRDDYRGVRTMIKRARWEQEEEAYLEEYEEPLYSKEERARRMRRIFGRQLPQDLIDEDLMATGGDGI